MALNLSPARWIWLPSQRTLANTFVLFRREIDLAAAPKRATGWIFADSRYRLTVNGERVQWGPAPCDPRWQEADPVDLTGKLQPGRNVIGVEALFYGSGDGTWALGRPGLICRLDLVHSDGRTEQIVTDESWQCAIDRAHRPGQYRRWFLRALQEEFDARLHPYEWDTPSYQPDARWMKAMDINGAPDKPSLCNAYSEYSSDAGVADSSALELRAREIPHLREEIIAARPSEVGHVRWKRDPADWCEFRVPASFEITPQPVPAADNGILTLPAPGSDEGIAATFVLPEQMVGWPRFTIDAPAGAIVELMIQEAHDPARTRWLDTHFYSWTRFVCREGVNELEAFDYESLRWMQIHVRNASRPVTISSVGARRRLYPWPNPAEVSCSEPALQRLMDACVNTLNNSVQETAVDGMGRERQQYSGDVGHQLHAVRYAFGETRQPVRYMHTYSQGQTIDGYFLDCWPGYDRLARIQQRQVGATAWGPLLDHGIGFNFDCWHHYLETGDLRALEEPYPRLKRFAAYLASIRGKDGLLPVENIGVPSVWLDHEAYRRTRHKQCAFNLYAAAMLQHALARIAEAFGESKEAAGYRKLATELQAGTVKRFWDTEREAFVVNLPWLKEEGGPRYCDRSLANAILFDQCPGGKTAKPLSLLVDCPPEMGFSYPANAGWRLWALAHLGRIDVVLRELRERWAKMDSVIVNNTMQENWHANPDSGDEWSHCPVAPFYLLYMDVAGIRPTAPGFAHVAIRPQLGDLGELKLTAHTVQGPIGFRAVRQADGHHVTVELPATCQAELRLPAGAAADLPRLAPDVPHGLECYALKAGASNRFVVPLVNR